MADITVSMTLGRGKVKVQSYLVPLFVCCLAAGMLLPGVSATAIKGTATKCTGLASCSYTISGGGSASASGGIGGYVGQNFTFSGGFVSYQLPGEALVTSANGVYSGTAINTKVFTSTAGLIYKLTGTFTTVDANNNKIVKGSTSGYVGIKGHSVITLLNGTIVFNPTNIDATVTSVTCNPSNFVFAGNSTTCTVTVTDLASASSIPTGTVAFSIAGFNSGTFKPLQCKLSSGSCSTQFTPSAADSGTYAYTIIASYKGTGAYYKSSASTTVTATFT